MWYSQRGKRNENLRKAVKRRQRKRSLIGRCQPEGTICTILKPERKEENSKKKSSSRNR